MDNATRTYAIQLIQGGARDEVITQAVGITPLQILELRAEAATRTGFLAKLKRADVSSRK